MRKTVKLISNLILILGLTLGFTRTPSSHADCLPAILKMITPEEVSNLQESIFRLRENGHEAEAQALENKVISILKGPYHFSKPLKSGAGGGNFYFFDLGVVGIGKKAGRHWSTSVEAEVAAFQLDRLYGLDLVPVTVAREETTPHMSIQLFYKDAKEARLQDLKNASATDRAKMKIFDYLIQNFDRRESNYLITPAGRIIAIDHGVSLHNARSNPHSPHAPKLKDLDLVFSARKAEPNFSAN